MDPLWNHYGVVLLRFQWFCYQRNENPYNLVRTMPLEQLELLELLEPRSS